jgi:hypothetical protein
MDGLLESTGYERVRAFRLPKLKGVFLPYSRVNYLENPENGARMRVYSGPNGAKLAPYRVEFFPPDDLGFDQATARAVFQHFEEPRISLVEMALDFPVGSDVDLAYVRARAVFGKCHPYSVGHRPGWDAWGTRKGAKFIRSYYKKCIGAHRVELQLQRPFIHRHRLSDIANVTRLADLLCPAHVMFAQLSEQRLARAMKDQNFSKKEIVDTVVAVQDRAGNLTDARHYLRGRGVENVQRLLVPVPADGSIRKALRTWAALWRLDAQDAEDES